jgi:hypothetical protein
MLHPTHSLFVYVSNPSIYLPLLGPGAISSCRPVIHQLGQLTLSLFLTADEWTLPVIPHLLI